MPVSAEVESLIADAPLSAHLATSVDDRPHVAPVWYGYRDGVLYFITGGRKLSNVRRNPRVAVSIEKATGGDVEWNVTLRGTATVRDDPDRIDWASDWIYDAYDDVTDDERGEEDDVTAENDLASEQDEAAGEDPDSTQETDGGESSEERRSSALVEVDIGSSSANVYE